MVWQNTKSLFYLKRKNTNEKAFTLSKTPSGVFKNMKSIQIIEDGDIFLGVEAFFEHENTRATIKYKIYKLNDDIDETTLKKDYLYERFKIVHISDSHLSNWTADNHYNFPKNLIEAVNFVLTNLGKRSFNKSVVTLPSSVFLRTLPSRLIYSLPTIVVIVAA